MARRAYSGPVYPHPIRTVNDLDNAMAWLVDQGRLPGARSGNSPTNVGETIEAHWANLRAPRALILCWTTGVVS